jgi:plasmid stabilization system protein ParE
MTKRIGFDTEAQDEIDAAVAWYDAQTEDARVGDALLKAIDRAVVRIVERPGTFAPAPKVSAELGVRRCTLRRFPYALIFVELDDEIRVLALAHERRRPGYWRGRLRRAR